MDGQTAICLVFASFSDGRWHIYDSTGRTISWCVGVGALGRGLLGVDMRRCVLGDWEGSSRAMDATNPGQVVMVGDGIRTCTTDHTYVPQLLAIAEASLRVVPVAHFRIGQSRA